MNPNNIYICDTNVLFSSLISETSPPSRTVDFIKENGVFALSKETIDELEDVLLRPKFDKFLSREDRQDFIEEVKDLSIVFDIYQKIDLCRDPKDNKFLDVAIASYADFLITGDEDLLVLKNIGNTSIITPRMFVDIHQN